MKCLVMSFLIPSDEIVCIALIKKVGTIHEIKAFYESLRYHRFKYTTKVDLDLTPNHFLFSHDPAGNFPMGFSDLSTFMVVKLAFPERIVDVWYK
ncbi:hypothetical protein D3C86_1516520 [compost metagenome]